MSRDDQPISSEDEIIRDFLRPLTEASDAALDLKDDAACLTPEPGHDLVITKDMLVAGVHFFPDDAPGDIGYKAITVNLSDLYAKGATPIAYFLSLALPKDTTRWWMRMFTKGLDSYIDRKLAGGDLVRTDGPLTISITAIGQVPSGRMVKRTTAQPGDHVYVSHRIGGSAAGLKMLGADGPRLAKLVSSECRKSLIGMYHGPLVAYGIQQTVLDYANASMDLSDGLVRDAGRLCGASGVGMELRASLVPLYPQVHELIDAGGFSIEDALTGGDDYQVLMTVPESAREELEARSNAGDMISVTRIGHVTDAAGELIVRDADGKPMVFEKTGHDHF